MRALTTSFLNEQKVSEMSVAAIETLLRPSRAKIHIARNFDARQRRLILAIVERRAGDFATPASGASRWIADYHTFGQGKVSALTGWRGVCHLQTDNLWNNQSDRPNPGKFDKITAGDWFVCRVGQRSN
jgi:hypothetical protein